MKVSRNTLSQSYSVPDNNFFATRSDRNRYFESYPSLLVTGTYCAIGGDPQSTDYSVESWELEMYNGANWTLQSVDPNYSLVITEDGLNALPNLNNGTYKLQISSVKIKQNHIVNPDVNLLQWTKEMFEGDGDIILDTNTNANFTFDNNIGWRTNLANGGIQFTIKIETDTYGEINGVRYDEFTIGAIGLYVKDPNSDQGNREVLFAIGNLNNNIPKYTTSASRVGNSIKLLLNLAITNLGYIADLTLFKESVNSVPEVMDETQLVEGYGTVISPYNFYLVDNYAGTNVPALAARRGDPTKTEVTWEYFTPRDDVIEVDSTKFASDVADYMIVNWDPVLGQFVKAEGHPDSSHDPSTNNLSGIKVNNNVIFAGNVINYDMRTSFNITIANVGVNYNINDELQYYDNEIDVTFKIKVTNVDADGGVRQFSVLSISGLGTLSKSDCEFIYTPETPPIAATGTGFKANIVSAGTASNLYIWNFPTEWLNMPLYVDMATPTYTGDGRTDGRGMFTNIETNYFVGWCTGTGTKSTVKLAMDLQDQASYIDYGTTRYATANETSDVTLNEGVSEVTSVVPKNLQLHYFQKSKVAGNPGESAANPVEVRSHVRFYETVVGKGADVPTNPDTNVSFYGMAYRAWWGDLAEYYRSDKVYPAGTLITVGCGPDEITKATTECNGIISERPGYELGEKKDERDLPVALVGKVPVIFDKHCQPRFGDRVYLSQVEPGKASTTPFGKCLGKIIDKANDLTLKGTILCSVRISF